MNSVLELATELICNKQTNKKNVLEQNLMKRDEWLRSELAAGAFLTTSFVWNLRTRSYYSCNLAELGICVIVDPLKK